MSALGDIRDIAGESMSALSRLSLTADLLEDLRLTDEQSIDLLVLLRDRLREVTDRIREVLDAGVSTAGPGGTRGGESGERVVKVGVDVHESSPSSVGADTTTVGPRGTGAHTSRAATPTTG